METKVLYTGKTHTTGGREGASQSSDDQLNIKLSSPGTSRPGTNPEQIRNNFLQPDGQLVLLAQWESQLLN
ncbi:hypothetical protein ACHRV6_22185 [Flavobacterium sp. FlaQc-51]|uniref:hypothetical protein n=1 Tax=Flavobacterium sp. FlaQc-51 TaxID=3374184 RepID=UPI003757440C